MIHVELKKIGNSSGFILPKEFIGSLGLEQGNRFAVTVNADGSFNFRRSDPTFDKGMEIAEKAMVTYRNALEKLAK